jgi:hypothetical protein
MLIGSTCIAQSSTNRIYINGGNQAWAEFINAIYLYQNFKPGLVVLKDGQRFYKPLNYNRVRENIDFINEKNDTLELADPTTVSTVVIDDDVFFFTPACVRSLNKGKARFFISEKIKVGDVQKVGAMGQPSAGTSIDTYQRIDSYQQSYDLNLNEKIILSKTTKYFVEAGENSFIPATKKNVLKTFQKDEAQIKEFIKSKNTNFENVNDLVELGNYISGL